MTNVQSPGSGRQDMELGTELGTKRSRSPHCRQHVAGCRCGLTGDRVDQFGRKVLAALGVVISALSTGVPAGIDTS